MDSGFFNTLMAHKILSFKVLWQTRVPEKFKNSAKQLTMASVFINVSTDLYSLRTPRIFSEVP
jgi:hypothetical protein